MNNMFFVGDKVEILIGLRVGDVGVIVAEGWIAEKAPPHRLFKTFEVEFKDGTKDLFTPTCLMIL